MRVGVLKVVKPVVVVFVPLEAGVTLGDGCGKDSPETLFEL